MSFLFNSYITMIELLKENAYEIINYTEYKKFDKCVILRHDIDMDLNQALVMADLEYKLGISSTYFLLMSGDLYNLLSKNNRKIIEEIRKMGHSIGLHFDESVYSDGTDSVAQITKNIKKEVNAMSELLGINIKCFSYHRPARETIQSNVEMEGLINVYGKKFFQYFKYLSDSRMHWREPVLEIIKSGQYKKLHILTHPFWYHEDRISMKDIIYNYVCNANMERYNNLKANITSLEDVIKDTEIMR